MNHHQFTLQAYKGPATRHTCPACGKPKCFKLYINTETNQPLSPTTGKCDREIKCGYHQTPKQYFETTGTTYNPPAQHKPVETKTTAPVSVIDGETLNASLAGYATNCFVVFLNTVFDAPTVNRLIETYKIGSSNHWPGATIFWQVDTRHNIRTGKIMLYNAATGKRVREPQSHIAWVHSTLKQADYNLQQCLFGQHLLRTHTNKPVALVESEKTAIIASAYLPQYVWLATGSLQGLTAERCRILTGKNVTLFPDLQGYNKWKEKAEQLSHICSFTISTLLEGLATLEQKAAGWDIADYLVTRNHKEFLANTAAPGTKQSHTAANVTRKQKLWQPPVESPSPRGLPPRRPCGSEGNGSQPLLHSAGSCKATDPARTDGVGAWDIATLETFFATYTPPAEPIRINSYSVITNPALYIASHLEMVRANRDKRTFKPYYDRLVELREWVGGQGNTPSK